MYIKRRLKITYAVMLIIPFILIITLNNIFISYIEGNAKYGLLARDNVIFFSKVISSNNKLLKQVNRQILKDSDKFLDREYLLQLEKSTGLDYTGIVLRKSNEIFYSSDYVKKDLNAELLPSFDSDIINKNNNNWHKTSLFVLGQQDFYFKDGTEGSIFYVLDVAVFKDFFKKNATFVIICTLLILVFTNGILTYLVSKSIIKPLKELENAAVEIKQGNLNYKININSKDEIGELGNSFEEMRFRLKKSLEIQRQYEENRKELISNISHDLKTPITSIKGYIEGIKDGIADTPEKMNKYINTIYTKAGYMDNLIDELFLFSKLDLNRVPFNFQTVDLGSFINDCVDEIKFDLDHDNIELTLNVIAEPTMVKIDIQKLKRVVMNIVGNSIKYKNAEKLKVNINIKNKENYVIIEVKDNGKGISQESLPFIFDRFFRADTSRETISGGSGLGLAIAKKIIEEHEGEIWVESKLNQGTTIFFTLKTYKRGALL